MSENVSIGLENTCDGTRGTIPIVFGYVITAMKMSNVIDFPYNLRPFFSTVTHILSSPFTSVVLNSTSSTLIFIKPLHSLLTSSPLANSTLAQALHAKLTATRETKPGDPVEPQEWEDGVGARYSAEPIVGPRSAPRPLAMEKPEGRGDISASQYFVGRSNALCFTYQRTANLDVLYPVQQPHSRSEPTSR